MMTFRQLQKEQAEWSAYNFGDQASSHQPLLGALEELGELHSAIIASHGEQWLPVVGYEDWYNVSNLGRICRTARGKSTRPGRLKKFGRHRQGYLSVALSSGSNATATRQSVHSVVAAAFIGPRPEGYEINHRNGRKDDNSAFNLEYVTHAENQRHAVRLGLWTPLRGEDHGCAKLSAVEVAEIRTAEGTHHEIAAKYGVSRSLVSKIKAGIIWAKQRAISLLRREESAPPVQVIEAMGRLAHAHLKCEQGIRGTYAEHELAKQDAVADIIIFLADYCTRENFDLQSLVEMTWAKVKQRDWKAYPQSGGLPPAPPTPAAASVPTPGPTGISRPAVRALRYPSCGYAPEPEDTGTDDDLIPRDQVDAIRRMLPTRDDNDDLVLPGRHIRVFYPCGCEASGPMPPPLYCPSHGSPAVPPTWTITETCPTSETVTLNAGLLDAAQTLLRACDDAALMKHRTGIEERPYGKASATGGAR